MGRGNVEIHRGKIRVAFRLNGKRCREPLGIDATPANMKYARRLVGEIIDRIRIGTFDYSAYFPDSPRARGQKAPDPTFGQQADRWLVTLDVAKSTRRSYEAALRAFWRPAFGDKPIRTIKPSDIKAELLQRVPNAKTRNNYLVAGRGVFGMALADETIAKDPTAAIRNAKVQTPEPDPFTIEEVERILERLSPELADYYTFAFFTGLRPSEQIALTWGDVDWPSRTVKVDKARVAWETKASTKTHHVRRVELNSRAVAALQRQRARSQLAGAEVWLNPDTGEPWNDEAYQRRKHWQPTLKRLGLRMRDAYQTRHTFATMNLMAGANPAWIAKQMGHKNAQMLWTRYGRWIPDADAGRERAKLEALLQNGPHLAPISTKP